MIEKVFILGNHIQALGISRLAQKAGLNVMLFSDYNASITRFSNSCNSFKKYKNISNLLDQLKSLSSPKKNVILIPTNDSLVWFLKENYDFLSKYYHLAVPSPEVTEICYNKRQTYKRALEFNIPIPQSFFPDNYDELVNCIESIKFPVIIKPAVMHTFFKNTGKKVLKCNSKKELIDNYKQITKIIPSDEVIVQEFLKGGPENLFSCGVFFANSKVYGSFVANRIRQKPMDFGISTTFAKTIVNEKISSMSHYLLTRLKYFGMAEVEFMFDSNNGNFKLIEINPRAWKWHYLADKLGINLVSMMADIFNNKEPEVIINNLENIAWIERLTDTYISVKEIFNGNLTFKKYLESLRLKKISAVWSWKDPFPGFMYIILSPYLLIKRN